MNNSENVSIFLPVFFSLLSGFAAGCSRNLYHQKQGKRLEKKYDKKELIEKGKKLRAFQTKPRIYWINKYKFSELKDKGKNFWKRKVKIEEPRA